MKVSKKNLILVLRFVKSLVCFFTGFFLVNCISHRNINKLFSNLLKTLPVGLHFKEKIQITLKIGLKGKACHQLKNLVKTCYPNLFQMFFITVFTDGKNFWTKEIDLEFAWCWFLFTVQNILRISVYNWRKKLIFRFFFWNSGCSRIVY